MGTGPVPIGSWVFRRRSSFGTAGLVHRRPGRDAGSLVVGPRILSDSASGTAYPDPPPDGISTTGRATFPSAVAMATAYGEGVP